MKKSIADALTKVPNLAELKQKHGLLLPVLVNKQLFLLKKVDMPIFSLASRQNENPVKMQQVILNNCMVYGDKLLLEDVGYFSKLSAIADRLFTDYESEVGDFL